MKAASAPRLKMYTAYLDLPHIMWSGWRDYKAGHSGITIDRLPLPVVASSLRHAKRLAEKAWGDRGRTGRIMVTYIGPCVEPLHLREATK